MRDTLSYPKLRNLKRLLVQAPTPLEGLAQLRLAHTGRAAEDERGLVWACRVQGLRMCTGAGLRNLHACQIRVFRR